ncbi:hypothetical protein CYMTET_10483 [Cymbomonas tetramitiformis]|uniref:Phosphoacetylglucosamine mutase n=1 Tax=Cymbomonas tetramitiformis TaxID=36881 RepID=A0AAE0LEF8_9CHLO|nr:hypothetical protein CYMTET_10483 [Cymbomonas tetramitiformis]
MEKIAQQAAGFPKPEGVFSYGTAGFRTEASLLPSTVFRCGILIALRALQQKAATGLMITASHNPEADNGVKLADPTGGMLSIAWEVYANELANAETVDALIGLVADIMQKEEIPEAGARSEITVLLGRDTRKSSAGLAAAAIAGIEAAGVRVLDLGLLTTPQLHYLVRAYNRVPAEAHTEEAYFESLASSFRVLVGKTQGSGAVICDAANGVGASKMTTLLSKLGPLLEMEVRNEGKGALNSNCGADFVQKEQKLPTAFESPRDDGRRCVSLDGDADRLVYFSCENGEMRLFDGDKIAVLFSSYIGALLKAVPKGEISSASVGVVQTAYANGSSTEYIRSTLGLQVETTPTGVKFLHRAAEEFDVGIYFEANGHGTVLFKEEWAQKVLAAPTGGDAAEGEAEVALLKLKALIRLINQAVGDALSGVLLVEAILRHNCWELQDWDALYTDLPSRQLKVKVADRAKIETMDAETRVRHPADLQPLIDATVARYSQGRAFTRPSGTEDVVRVYAEAATRAETEELAVEVARHVYDKAGDSQEQTTE